MKKKKLSVVIIILFVVLFFYFLKFIAGNYIEKNHDITIEVYSADPLFAYLSYKKYYFVNSSLGLKTKIKKFDTEPNKISPIESQQIQEIKTKDDKFKIDENWPKEILIKWVFFYNNLIFYTRNTDRLDPSTISDEDRRDFEENIYKYNIDTKDIEQIKIQTKLTMLPVDIKLEALTHIYPKLKKAIIKQNEDIKNDLEVLKTLNNDNYEHIFYSKDRIFFSTSPSSSINKKHYLYEYINATNTIKKITSTTGSIEVVDVIK